MINKAITFRILSKGWSSSNTTKYPRNYSQATNNFDLAIVGGGIVGLSTAREILLRKPSLKVVVLEKEGELASHQSGHNSGVIHAGIYYAPDSLKARLCVKGLHSTYKYCDENNIPYKKCGKLIVAVEQHEIATLDNLMHRGTVNNVPDLRFIEGRDIPEIEPNCIGLKAIFSPHTGIVDWRRVALSYASNFKNNGGSICVNFEVQDFLESSDNPDYPVTLTSSNVSSHPSRIQCKYVITCGGLHADKLAEKSGCKPTPKIVPFRGDYLQLKPEKCDLIRGNIYPVPDLRFPFLGVHFTPRIDGSVLLGPNAVLSLKREGYNTFDFNLRDAIDAIKFSGVRKIAYKYLGVGFKEIRGVLMPSHQVKLLRRYIPKLSIADVSKGLSGVRAQALNADGSLVDDFVFDIADSDNNIAKRILHVRNAPSPAATSSLPIGELIVDKTLDNFSL